MLFGTITTLFLLPIIFIKYSRNLCIDGGHELCAEMYNKGVLSPLKAFIPKVSIRAFYLREGSTALHLDFFFHYSSSCSLIHNQISSALHGLITSPKSAPENAAELVYGLAENVITLLWCLS